MFRFRSCPSSLRRLVSLAAALSLLSGNLAEASTCRSDPGCAHAFARAEALSNRGQSAAALGQLQVAYERVADPRLLVSMGILQLKQGKSGLAREYCRRAQTQAPADIEVQEQARDCLSRTEKTPPLPETVKLAAPVSRSEARGGTSHVETTVNNHVSITPQCSFASQSSALPQIQTLSPKSEATAPLYRRWWLWTGLGVLATGAIGLGFGMASREPSFVGYPIHK